MKEFYVSASLYYGYTIEVPDDFDASNESEIMERAYEADPLKVDLSNVDNPSIYYNYISDKKGNVLYDWG